MNKSLFYKFVLVLNLCISYAYSSDCSMLKPLVIAAESISRTNSEMINAYLSEYERKSSAIYELYLTGEAEKGQKILKYLLGSIERKIKRTDQKGYSLLSLPIQKQIINFNKNLHDHLKTKEEVLRVNNLFKCILN